MGSYVYGSKAVCPFYVREAKKSITCEGLIDDQRYTVTHFPAEEEKRQFQDQRCGMQDYAIRCKLAAALLRKYEAQGSDD